MCQDLKRLKIINCHSPVSNRNCVYLKTEVHMVFLVLPSFNSAYYISEFFGLTDMVVTKAEKIDQPYYTRGRKKSDL